MLRTLIACVALLLTIAVASARDVVTLKDGRTVEGDIIREIDGNIWMIVYIGDIKKQEFFAATGITKIERDATVDVADAPESEKATAVKSGVPKGMVITLEGMVGVEMAAHKIEELLPLIEEEIGENGILVLKINSGGGFTAEVQLLSDVIEDVLKPKFEVVGWIESAISAAAMTAATLERLYFMPEGNLGAATEFYGASFIASKGINLERRKYQMEMITARGKRDYKIMESMQVGIPLSATVYPTGEVKYFQSEDDGEILLNRTGDIFTFNSIQAEQVRFSEGIARDVFELAHEMGYDEVDWVGEWEEGMVHPISKAEKQNRQWRGYIDQNKGGLSTVARKYILYSRAAQGAGPDDVGILVGKARSYLRQIKRYAELSPKLVTVTPELGIDWNAFDQWYQGQEDFLRRLIP